MASSGKSKRPPPRDNRKESMPPGARHPTARVTLRSARPPRMDLEGGRAGAGPIVDLKQDVARLRAELASDADELGAMLVRVAASDRARDIAEKRALALEKWGQELEGKVAEARTRGDELEEELVRVKDALEVERVRRTFDLETLTNKHRAELGALGPRAITGMGDPAAREAMGKVIATLEELEKHESQSALARRRAFDQAREFIAAWSRHGSRDGARGASVAPPPPVTKDVPTVPPTKSSARRSRRPLPAPPSRPPSRPSRSSIPAPTPKSVSAPYALSIKTPLSVPTSVPTSGAPTSAVPTPVSAALQGFLPPGTVPPASAPASSKRELLTFEDLELED